LFIKLKLISLDKHPSLFCWNINNIKNVLCTDYRMTTFMVYLSDVPLGGHTVFLQAGKYHRYRSMN